MAKKESRIPASGPGRPYRVPAELAYHAEARAAAIRKKTGKAVTWTNIIRQVLEAGLKT